MDDTQKQIQGTEPDKSRGKRRIMEGVVISKKQDKTVTVQVEFPVKHPKYNKYVRRRMSLLVHDEENASGVGDKTQIVECRPISKMKNWRLLKVIEKAKI